jgi:ribosome biogenesis GTPase
MPTGRIMKALSGYYFVLPDEGGGEPVRCRARGVFKNRGVHPLVGDRVSFRLERAGEGTVTEVFPRKSELIRPPVANVDTAVLVFSVARPALNLRLLDKFLVHTEHAGLDAILCFTKMDLLRGPMGEKTEEIEEFRACLELYRKIGYPCLCTSTVSGEGIGEVKELLKGNISVFAGQSGVGKSSLLNALLPGLAQETREISTKLGRGRHTTRHVELFALPEGGVVADTPGFSQLDFAGVELSELSACFIEFASFSESCRFRGCLHRGEPGCRVIEAVEDGSISPGRYEHYVAFLEEIRERKPRY